MKQTLASWLRRMAEWLDPSPSPESLPQLEQPVAAPAAPPVVRSAGADADARKLAGEIVRDLIPVKHTPSWKALAAYKQLRAHLPHHRTRDLKLAIELAVQDLP